MLLPAVWGAGALCPPGKFWQRHMLVSSGRCHSAPGDVAACEAAAAEMGLSSTAAPVRAMPAYPPGCIVVRDKADRIGSLNLYFNTVPAEQSGNNCNSIAQCVCPSSSSSSSSSSCRSCPPGKWKGVSSSTYCHACPAGRFIMIAGATSFQCAAVGSCPAGQRWGYVYMDTAEQRGDSDIGSTVCAAPITSRAACTAAATELARRPREAKLESSPFFPSGCYDYFGELLFNGQVAAAGGAPRCSHHNRCICHGCAACLAGTWARAAGARTACSGAPCAQGSLGPTGARNASAATCARCPAGTYAPSAGGSACKACTAGRFAPGTRGYEIKLTGRCEAAVTSATACEAAARALGFGALVAHASAWDAGPGIGCYVRGGEASREGSHSRAAAAAAAAQLYFNPHFNAMRCGARDGVRCLCRKVAGASGQCLACPASKWQSAARAAACVSCPVGKHSFAAGADAASACSATPSCPAGQVWGSAVQTEGRCGVALRSASECNAVGRVSAALIIASGGAAAAADVGTVKDAQLPFGCLVGDGGVTGRPPLLFNALALFNGNQCSRTWRCVCGACRPCPGGTFAEGWGARTACNGSSCAAGTGGPQGSTSASANCTSCPAGQYANGDDGASCKQCPLGKYQRHSSSSSCVACAPWSSTRGAGATADACVFASDHKVAVASCAELERAIARQVRPTTYILRAGVFKCAALGRVGVAGRGAGMAVGRGVVVVIEGQGRQRTTLDLDHRGCLFEQLGPLDGGDAMLARLSLAQSAASCPAACALHLMDAQCVASLDDAGGARGGAALQISAGSGRRKITLSSVPFWFCVLRAALLVAGAGRFWRHAPSEAVLMRGLVLCVCV